MNLNRWLSIMLMMGLILAFNPLGAQARPYPYFEDHPKYHHPHGRAYGWHGPRHHGKHFRRYHHRNYVRQAGPPPVVYVQPVTPIMGVQPCPQPQPYYSQPAAPGFSAQFNFGF